MAQLPTSSSTKGQHVYRPFLLQNKCDEITIKWEAESDTLPNNCCFEVFYKIHNEGRWKNYPTEEPCLKKFMRVQNLKPDSEYIFKVKVVDLLTDNEGPYSPVSDTFKTCKSAAIHLMEESQLIVENTSSSLPRYQLQIKEIPNARNEDKKTRKFVLGKPGQNVKEKTIMLVGATGSGKTTLVNAMANYICDVRWQDPFRFSLVNLEREESNKKEAVSQTTWVTCYTIYQLMSSRLNYNINIIDTPGFGHTGGIDEDKKIVEQIKHLFQSPPPCGVQCIDAICFIVKSPDARLTVSQQYIFRSILSLFGNDIQTNICTIVTFADGQTPPVIGALAALEDHPLPYKMYFPVNNSALYTNCSNSIQGAISPTFWEMGKKCFDRFFSHVEAMTTKSLTLTSSILTLREAIENTICNMEEELGKGLITINSIQQEIEILRQNTIEIEKNKYFSYEVNEMQQVKDERFSLLKSNHTTCQRCSFTCHKKCSANDVKSCLIFNNEKCTECPGHCTLEDHLRTNWSYRFIQIKVTKILSERKEAYEVALQKHISTEDLISKMEQEIDYIHDKIYFCVVLVDRHTKRLQELALISNPLSTVDYIEMMIANEQLIKRDGFQNRITALEKCKKRIQCPQKVLEFDEKFKETKRTLKYMRV